MKTIRVLEITNGFAVEGPLGGIERFVIELAQAMDKDRVTPIVCGLWDWGTPFEDKWRGRLHAQGIETVIAARKDDDAPYRNYVDVIRGIRAGVKTPVDIIHSHSEFGDVAAALLRRPLGAKAIVRTVHNEREWSKRPLRRLLLSTSLYPFVFDRELGVSQQVVENLDRRPAARLIGRKAQVLYNAIDLQRFERQPMDRTAKRAELHIAPDAPVIGSIGRLSRQKGYRVLLEAVPMVLARQPNALFLIIGDGELASALRGQAQRLGVDRSVRFMGPRSDIEELLAVMDIFVSSSLWEGLPTVILEAMAANTPVVATRVSGNVELVRPDETGFLVPPDDPEALAAAMLAALLDPEKSRRMSENAREYVQANFSITGVANQHVHMYQRLMNQ